MNSIRKFASSTRYFEDPPTQQANKPTKKVVRFAHRASDVEPQALKHPGRTLSEADTPKQLVFEDHHAYSAPADVFTDE